jgi:MFS family permease
MSRWNWNWWHWLLVGIGFCVIAIVTGPVADRHGYATSLGLAVSILAWIASSVCGVVAVIRFVKGVLATS